MRARLVLVGLTGLVALAAPARPQTAAPVVVTSAAPDHVAVTLYRAPNRTAESGGMNADYPQGYALVTETRTVTVPAGVAVIRFEGVAGNILPESALLAGLPDGVEEKNLDASLLSPRSLYDRALGRRVVVKRTNKATGKVELLQATLRSGVEGAAVLQFAGGDYGDLQCSGLPETLVYDGVPPGLSARPTLSVRTISSATRQVTLTLSYLAGGFDWQADYIVAMQPGGRSADLFAWITLASNDVTSFPDADLQVVAGNPNRERTGDSGMADTRGDLSLKCWPLPDYDYAAPGLPPPPPPAPPPMAESLQDIVVTGSLARRANFSAVPIAVVASAEQLGDLKLYRFPRRVTVASNSQKQVGMLSKPSVKLAPFYRSTVGAWGDAQTQMLLRGKNLAANGLGVPLPGGRAAIFTDAQGHNLMIAESSIGDKAVGEEFELVLGEPGAVKTQLDRTRDADNVRGYTLTITNANRWAIDYEAEFDVGDNRAIQAHGFRLGRKNGKPIYAARIPANGKLVLTYVIEERNDDPDEPVPVKQKRR